MSRNRRAVPALLGALGALAFAAPAAHAVPQSMTFPGVGTVTADEQGDADNNVAFTITGDGGTDPASLRLFIDTFDTGESYVSAGGAGVVVTPYKGTSTPGCQVFQGTAFPLAAVTYTPGTSLTFSVPKDYMRPRPRLMLVDSNTATACAGVDGSGGFAASFGGDEARLGASWPWAIPSAPVGLTATSGPGSVTLSWTPVGDQNGVHYQIVESGVSQPVVENVTGNSFTIDGLAPGVGHSYQVRAFRFWEGADGRQFSAFTPLASAIAGALPANGGGGGQGVRGASARSAGKKSSARLAAPKGLRARASRNRVSLTLPKVPKGSKLQIFRATGKKGGKFARKATTSRRSWTDRKVTRGTTYRYRIVRITSGGQLSVPSQTVTVRVPRR